MAEKPYYLMDDTELRAALSTWERNVETATGWASAYFAACQLRTIVETGNKRGLAFENRFPIRGDGRQ
jgi:hypothetical protein